MRRPGAGIYRPSEGTAQVSQARPAVSGQENSTSPSADTPPPSRVGRLTQTACRVAAGSATAGLAGAFGSYSAELVWHWVSQML